jgi:hypothetical protein
VHGALEVSCHEGTVRDVETKIHVCCSGWRMDRLQLVSVGSSDYSHFAVDEVHYGTVRGDQWVMSRHQCGRFSPVEPNESEDGCHLQWLVVGC